jgi:CPA1 family monovalent cation:H+ antiporter
MFDVIAACLVITALFSWLNRRFLGAPATIGAMGMALGVSLVLGVLDSVGVGQGLRDYEETLLRGIDFSDVLMRGMLSLLLFAGALHVDLSALRHQRWTVLGLAVVGTTVSTVIVGFGVWLSLPWVGMELDLLPCLVFGALISPTDPIAVMGILKDAHAPEDVELIVSGESLFNDGIGVVIFTLLASAWASGAEPSLHAATHLLLREAGGGLVFGLVLGYVTYRLLKSVDDHQVEVLLTLAAVTGGYALAARLHISGPLAMVVTGLFIGNRGRQLAMSAVTRRYVDMFWEVIDGILNAVLFVLIGMEVVLVDFSGKLLLGGAVATLVTLLSRFASAGLPTLALGPRFGLPRSAWRILTWGGLRGGISVALVLSLNPLPDRNVILTLTYCVVVFSILVQGLTIGRVVRHTFAAEPPG